MHSILKQQDRILPDFQRLSAEAPLKLGNVSQIHGANDDIQPTVFVQISRRHQIPLIGGGDAKCIRAKLISACVFKKDDASLGMFVEISKIAGDQNIETTVIVEIGDFGPGCSIHREKIALAKIVLPIILQNPDSMVGLQNARIVKIVAVHIQNVDLSVAIKTM